jgi:hypothetical protein
MTFEDRPGQIVKAPSTGLTAVPLAMFLCLIATEFDGLLAATMGAANALWPAQPPNNFEALSVVDQILDFHQPSTGRVLDLHAAFSRGVVSQETIRDSSGVV